MQMNKFHFSRSDLPDALLLWGLTMIIAKISSVISDTPVFITMFVLTIWVMIIAIYLSFIENRKAVLDKWLANKNFDIK